MIPLSCVRPAFRPGPPARGAGAICLGILLLALLALAGPARAGQGRPVRWLSYQKAMALRQESPRPLLIFFHAPWCYMCRKMKRRVFSHRRLAAILNREFLPVSVDVTRQPGLKEKFKVSGLPTLIFLDRRGKPVLRLHGYVPGDRLKAALDYVGTERYLHSSWPEFLSSRP